MKVKLTDLPPDMTLNDLVRVANAFGLELTPSSEPRACCEMNRLGYHCDCIPCSRCVELGVNSRRFAGFTPPGNEMTRVLASADPRSYIEAFASVNGEPAFVSMMQMSYAFAVGMRHATAKWPRTSRR